MSVAEALAAMDAHPVRRAAHANVPIESSHGRTLAASVKALEDVPPFSRSRVDGYAVVASDVEGATKAAPARLAVLGEIAMGALANGAIASGSTMRVSTGGALPRGADGAVMVEDTVETGGQVNVYEGGDARDNVTQAGADVRAGASLFDAGTVLTPAKIGLLAGAGIAHVDVFNPPRVGLLMTGDELVAPGERMRPGQIRDINRYSLSAALTAMGFEPIQYDRVPDDRNAFDAIFARALADCDAIVVSGGSSAGERDFTPDVVAAAGKPGVIVHHIRAKPGRPTLLGIVGNQPVIGLPGNPVSALVMLETVGRPVLMRMLGSKRSPVPVHATLATAIDLPPYLEHLVPVRLLVGNGEVRAEPLFGTSAQMHVLAFADALVTVPLGSGRIEAGTFISAIPLSAGSAPT